MLSTDQALLTEEQSWHQRAILGALQAIRKPPPILGLLEVCGRRICPQRGVGADFAVLGEGLLTPPLPGPTGLCSARVS